MSWEFLVTAVVVTATPGAGVVCTLAAALSQGARAGVVAALGCTLGIVPHVLAAVTGLAALLHTSATAFQVVKYAGVAYLVLMAVQMWRDRDALVVADGAPARTSRRIVTSAVLLNLLNPKLTIFFFAFLPQFVPAGSPGATAHMLGLSAVFMALTFAIFAVYGLCAAGLRAKVISRPRVVTWIRRSFAASFLVLAGRLAVQRA